MSDLIQRMPAAEAFSLSNLHNSQYICRLLVEQNISISDAERDQARDIIGCIARGFIASTYEH